jgi:hypothetical protein
MWSLPLRLVALGIRTLLLSGHKPFDRQQRYPCDTNTKRIISLAHDWRLAAWPNLAHLETTILRSIDRLRRLNLRWFISLYRPFNTTRPLVRMSRCSTTPPSTATRRRIITWEEHAIRPVRSSTATSTTRRRMAIGRFILIMSSIMMMGGRIRVLIVMTIRLRRRRQRCGHFACRVNF